MQDSQQDFRKKRQEYTINIRRNNRQELFNKRRNLEQSANQEEKEQKTILIIDERYHQQIQQMTNTQYDDTMLDQLINCVNSPDVLLEHRGIIGLRKIIARNYNPPIKQFVDRGLLKLCMDFTKQKEFPQLKLEAAWILANIASGQSQYCQKIVQKDGIDLFINLLMENSKGIVDQAIWGIGNLAADNTKYRDQILTKGGLDALIKVINNTQNKAIVKNGTWAVTNLCRGFPAPKSALIKNACELLCRVIKSEVVNLSNKEILSDVIWAISTITEGNKAKIETVNQQEILGYIFKFALDPFKQLYIPSLKIIGNFASGNENHTNALIKAGIFDLALTILDHPKKSMKIQMCWILSNIAAGVASQVQAFLARKDLLDKIATLFHHDVAEVKREICWIYPNFGHIGDRQKVIQICLEYDLMRVYSNMLEGQQDSTTLQYVLQTLYKLFLMGKKHQIDGKNILLQKFLDCGGGSRLQQLQKHKQKKIYEGVVKILTKFFQLQTETL